VATTAEAARRVALRCENVNRWFGGLHALKGPDLAIFQGEIFGLVGPNGSGKTTLVNTVTGFYPPQKGRVFLFDEQINGLPPYRIAQKGVARTFQNVALFRGLTRARQHPSWGATSTCAERTRHARLLVVGEERGGGAPRQGRGCDRPPAARRRARRARRCHPPGLQKRVELARALAAEPRLLLLDEPMAGMNQEEKEYMVRFILDAHEDLGLTILMIEHHMDVVTSICHRVAVFNDGVKIAEGAPRETINDPAVVAAYIGASDAA